jgi:hypothetical protein
VGGVAIMYRVYGTVLGSTWYFILYVKIYLFTESKFILIAFGSLELGQKAEVKQMINLAFSRTRSTMISR